MSQTEAQIDVATAPPPSMPDAAADSSTALETSPVLETTADAVSVGDGADQSQPTDIFEGIPSIEELTQQAEQKVPYSEGILRLRTELERVKPDLASWEKFKPLSELGEAEELRSAYERHQKLFSPVINPETNQPEYDDRGLQKRTSQPWLAEMEAENPGFMPRHLNDILQSEYTDPVTKQTDNLLRFHFRSLGLDPDRYEDYRNLDNLLAKSNGAVTQAELDLVPEPDRAAYKTLPASLRSAWDQVPEDEQRFHLDGAKERLENRQWREKQEADKQQAVQQHQQQFQTRVQNDIIQDLSKVRTEGLTSLRDSLTKAVQLSADPAVNGAYIDAIIAPLALLLSPDFHDLGSHMIEQMGVKLDQGFNDSLNAFVTARQEYVIAKAYEDAGAMKTAQKEADGKFARIMAKFNELALKRAQTFGYQAKQIATVNGNALAAANARPMPGNGSAVEANQGILPAGMDAYSPEANKHIWSQVTGRGQ